jgi:lipopolysaccharide/colanic/teichoic acid biosynthesis glycosyltransferase
MTAHPIDAASTASFGRTATFRSTASTASLASAASTAASSALDCCAWLARYPVRRSVGRAYVVGKRTLDVAVALVVAVVVLPLVLAIAIAVKVTSRGPVLYRQRRAGRSGRPLTLVKLRTMVRDADQRKTELAALNMRQPPDFKIVRDPRVTVVGRVIRAASLDELPQLFNVLKGDLSLVGPRPTSLMRDEYAPWQTERFEVTPGLTGLWQIVARDDPSFDTRGRLDIAYATRRCLRLDIEILLRTIPSVVFARGAW